MLWRIVCWFIGHRQAYEKTTIAGRPAEIGYCSRCKTPMLTFNKRENDHAA